MGISAKLEIFRDLNNKEISSLFRDINRHLKIKGKQLTQNHDHLIKLVEKHGGVPEKGIMKFWEKIRQEWNKKYQNKKYMTSIDLRKAYQTILKREKMMWSGQDSN